MLFGDESDRGEKNTHQRRLLIESNLRLSARPNPVIPMMADLRFALRQLLK
jgi:hypothetical protein